MEVLSEITEENDLSFTSAFVDALFMSIAGCFC